MSDRDREAFRLKLKAEDRNTSVHKHTETDNSRDTLVCKMRFFTNRLPDFVPEKPVSIDKSKWHDNAVAVVKTILERMPPDPSTCSGGLYVGNIGVGYMLYYLATHEAFQTERQEYLEHAFMYVKVNTDYIGRGRMRSDPLPSFLLGQAGVMSLCSLLYKTAGDEKVFKQYCAKYAQFAEECKKMDFCGKNGSDELFVGRAGYLCGVLALQQKTGHKVNQAKKGMIFS